MLNRRREGNEVCKRVIEGVKRYVNTVIVPKPRPTLVVLYGSFARGDWGPGSDVDLIVAENLLGSMEPSLRLGRILPA